MRGDAGDDIVQAVAVHVAGIHLRAAGAELERMKRPHRIARERLRLFPPAVLFQQVRATVAIHVAHAHAVGEFAILVVG